MADPLKRKMSSAKDADPVVENPKLPAMTEKARRPRRIGGKVLRMPDEPTVPKGKADRMKPVPKRGSKPRGARAPFPDQADEKGISERGSAAGGDEGYVRLRIRVDDGEMSVQGIKAVEGPLIANQELHGDLAYEVAVGGRRVASGSVPDAGVNRSFPHPDPAPGQEGHHLAPIAAQEFIARVPAASISLASLPRMNVKLFRIKQGPIPRVEGPQRLERRFGKELREVAELRGVRLEQLPRSVRSEAKRSLR